MQEEDISRKPSDMEGAPKKRGPKPKSAAGSENKKKGRPKKSESAEQETAPQAEGESSAKSLNDAITQAVKNRPRGKRNMKISRTDGPVWREAPAQAQSEPAEDSEENLFVPESDRDGFGYTKSEESNDENNQSSDDDNEDTITSFSRADEEAAQDDDSRMEEARNFENAAAEDSQEKGGENRNQQNQNQNRNQNWQNRNQQNKNNRHQNQNRNQQNQNKNQNWQNRNQQNQNRNNQQNQNRNQQNQQKQKQQQQQRQKKPRWMQSQSEGDVMNPGDLPEMDFMRSKAALDDYLAQVFLGKVLAAPSQTETSVSQDGEVVQEQVAEEQKPAEAEKIETAPETVPEVEEVSSEPFVESKTYGIAGFGEIESLEDFDEIYKLGIREIQQKFDELEIPYRRGVGKSELMSDYLKFAFKNKKLVRISGSLDIFEDGFGGSISFATDSYRLRKNSVYVPQMFIDKYALRRGHSLVALAVAPRENARENCPFAVKIISVMGENPATIKNVVGFTDLVPYYPTRRIIMESEGSKENLSMRSVDLLTPVGFGQRALIVAPPRTGKTMLMQGMAKSIRTNAPDAHLMILLVDERPEEVTDFKRSVDAEVVSSTFDEEAFNHIHAAEMVISRARRMVEHGKDVIILLDSITRLARAYNAMMPNGGRTMSGGVEANALQKPKKFFGSARNIEGGGSLTIIGTALVETGSKMDEVIFEEFKGTGNLELHLDRALSDKRIFPAINIEKSGTRKEELLYHPDEMAKIYSLRRAMKGVPATDAMEMLIQRLKKMKTNVEFLLGLNR